MKKVLHLLLLVFAFTMGAQAQESKDLASAAKAKQNVYEVTNAVDTNGNDQFFVNLNAIFIAKHNALAKEGITEAEKNEVYATVDKKLRAVLSEDQIKTLMQQPGLYERLLKK